MGTNFYTTEHPPCEHCGRGGDEIHIGKSSLGWAFTFRSYPDRDLTSCPEWYEFLKERLIIDEYGKQQIHDEFFKFIKSKKNLRKNSNSSFDDDLGYCFVEREFS